MRRGTLSVHLQLPGGGVSGGGGGGRWISKQSLSAVITSLIMPYGSVVLLTFYFVVDSQADTHIGRTSKENIRRRRSSQGLFRLPK